MRRQREEMIELLLDLARAESPSHEREAQREPQRILVEALQELGFRVRRIRGHASGGHVLAVRVTRKRKRAVQLLLGHCDTVWPRGTLEQMPAQVVDGAVRGPGTYDMKAGLVQMLFALRALRELELEPTVEPIVFVNSDEEIGSPESTRHVRRLARLCDRVFVLEPSLEPGGRLKTARKGVGRFVIRVTGRAAHAGLDPDGGASAILELAHLVVALDRLNDPPAGVTVNVGTIEGGLRPNVIAPASRAEVDVRVLTSADAARIERALRDLPTTVPGTSLAIEGGFNRPPLERTPGNRVLWSKAEAAAAELGLEIGEGTAGGGSDGNTTSQFAPTLDGLGAVGDGAHATHEHVIADRMPERAALLGRLLLEPPRADVSGRRRT